MDNKQLDPEMLKNLDLLLDMDLLENEKEWPMVEEIDVVDSKQDLEDVL